MFGIKKIKALREAVRRAKVRRKLIRSLKSAVEKKDSGDISAFVHSLANDHVKSPRARKAVVDAFNTLIDRRDRRATDMALQVLKKKYERNDAKGKNYFQYLQNGIARSTLKMVEGMDKNNLRKMEIAAGLCLASAQATAGNWLGGHSITAWGRAMDALLEKSPGNHALAAACNAVITGSPAMSAFAWKKFEAGIFRLAQANRPLARKMAKDFWNRCAEFKNPCESRAYSLVCALN
jgi:hypothetical protein